MTPAGLTTYPLALCLLGTETPPRATSDPTYTGARVGPTPEPRGSRGLSSWNSNKDSPSVRPLGAGGWPWSEMTSQNVSRRPRRRPEQGTWRDRRQISGCLGRGDY